MIKKTFTNQHAIILIIFLFAFSIRIWSLNQMGRTWDEAPYFYDGYNFTELIKKGDFLNAYWYEPHSMDMPPLGRYLYGAAVHFDITDPKGGADQIFSYDITHARLVSVLLSSLAVALVVVIGTYYISLFVGVIAGIILGMLPFFLGLSQQVTLESLIMFFFTSTVYSFMRFMEKSTIKRTMLTGILLGLTMQIKLTNALILPLFLIIFFSWYKNFGKRDELRNLCIKIFLILGIALVIYIVLWPQPWLRIGYFMQYTQNRIIERGGCLPDIFLGKLHCSPIFYYVLSFLITTPIVLLVLFTIGLLAVGKTSARNEKRIAINSSVTKNNNSKKYLFIILKIFSTDIFSLFNKINRKNWYLYIFVLWFFIPFLLSFYSFRQHGVRYIIEIYAPFSLISAYGFDKLASKFTKKSLHKFILFLPILGYLFLVLAAISPYYLDYFNEAVGGTNTVYKEKLFAIGWWGDGLKAASDYLDSHAKKNEKIGLALDPPYHTMKKNIKYSYEKFNPSKKYDYIVVNYYAIIRAGFNEDILTNDYYIVDTVYADNAQLVHIFKHK